MRCSWTSSAPPPPGKGSRSGPSSIPAPTPRKSRSPTRRSPRSRSPNTDSTESGTTPSTRAHKLQRCNYSWTGPYRMRVVTPALPGSTGDYILFVNPDARSSTALYAQGLSEIADVWDVYVHDASGNPADPYYMEVQLVAVR